MAIINENDFISEKALQRPAELSKSIDKIVGSLLKLLDAAKQSSAAIENSKSTNKISQEGKKLAQIQKELTEQQQKSAKAAMQMAQSQQEVAKYLQKSEQGATKMWHTVNALDVAQSKAANSATALGKASLSGADSATKAQKVYQAEAGTLELLIQKRSRLVDAIAKEKKIQAEDFDLLKKGIITRAEWNQRLTESNAGIARNNAGIQSLNSQIKTHIALNGQLSGEYKKLVLQLEAARNKYKDMAASGKATNDQLKAQQAVFESLNKKVTAIDQTVGQFQRNVGNYPRLLEAATAGISRFIAAFGVVGGVYLFAKALKDGISLVQDFEYKNSTLQAVLGETKQGIKELTDQQLKFGASTIYTANSVADLQIIYSKLGLTTKEIQGATEATLNLATATGEDLAKSADVVGTVMRSFGLSAQETTRIVDVMTGAFNQTTLGLDNYFEAIKYVAPVAKANNISLEETTALLGTLADSGIRGSMAGTALRKIISELDRGAGTLQEKLKKLSAEGFSSADAMDEVGRTAYASLLVLTKNTEETDRLAKSLHNVQGSAEAAAKVMADNLTGDIGRLTGATQALVLTYRDGFLSVLRDLVQGLTTFIHIIAGLPKFLKDNRQLILALTVALVGFNAAAITASASALLAQFNLLKLGAAFRAATVSTRAFFATLAANPIGLVLIGIAGLIAAIDIYDRNSERAIKVARELNQLNQGLGNSLDYVTKAQKALNFTTEAWLKMSEAQKKSAAEQLEFTINIAKANLYRLKVQNATLAKDAEQLTLWQKIKATLGGAVTNPFNQGGAAAAAGADAYASAQENVAEATGKTTAQIEQLEKEIEGLSHLYDDNAKASKENAARLSDDQKKRILNAKRAQLELDKFRLEEQIKVQEALVNNENNSEGVRLAATVEAEGLRAKFIQKEADLLKLGKIKGDADLVEIEERKQVKLTENVKKGAQDRDKVLKDSTEKELNSAEYNAKIQTERIVLEAQIRKDAAILAVQKEVEAGKKTRRQGDKEIREIEIASDKEVLEIAVQSFRAQIDAERNIYFEGRKRLIQNSTMSDADKAAALVNLEKETNEEILELDKGLAETQKELNNQVYNNSKRNQKSAIQQLQIYGDAVQSFNQSLGALFSSLSQTRIQNIDKEIAKVQEQFDKEIEAAGDNEKAKAQLQKREEARIAELNRKKISEQRKQARIEKVQAIASATIQGAVAIVTALKTPFLVPIIAAAVALQIAAILSTPLPAYAEGTDYHPGGLALVGDGGGHELVKFGGKTYVTPDHPTTVNLPRGAEVLADNNPETVRTLAAQQVAGLRIGDRSPNYDGQMLQELKNLNKNVKSGSKTESLVSNGHALYRAVEADGHRTQQIRDYVMGKPWK